MKKRLFITIIFISIFLLAVLHTYSFATNPCILNISDGSLTTAAFTITPGIDNIFNTYIFTNINANFQLIYSGVPSGILSAGSTITDIPGKEVTLYSPFTTPPTITEPVWATHMIEIVHTPTGINTEETWDLNFFITTPPDTIRMEIVSTNNLDIESGTSDFTGCPLTLHSIGPQVMNEGQTRTINLHAEDTGPIFFLIDNMPDFCTFTESIYLDGNAVLDCQPLYTDANIYEITVTATLPLTAPHLSCSETFTLTVNDVDRAPDLLDPGNQSMPRETTLIIPLEATDEDTEDMLTFYADVLPGFCTLVDDVPIDPTDRTASIICQPTASTDFGDYIISVGVQDNGMPILSDTETFTLTVARPPTDLVFVLDASGSMLQSDKYDKMVEAAQLFYDIFTIIEPDDIDDRWGAVLFQWDCLVSESDNTISWPLTDIVMPPTDIRPALMSVPPKPPQVSGYCTPIGVGLETAKTLLPLPELRKKIFFLLSDGLENRGTPTIDDVVIPDSNSLANDVTVYAIGLGEGSEIESAKMSALASSSGGDYIETADPMALDMFFIQHLCTLTGKEMLDPNDFGSVQYVNIAESTPKAIFIVTWSDPTQPIDFSLRHPNGEMITPTNVTAGISKYYSNPQVGDLHAFYIIEEDGTPLTIPGDQEWTITNFYEAGTTNPVTASKQVIVLEDLLLRTKFAIKPDKPFAGEPIILTAEIKEGDVPVLDAEVYAYIDGPIESANNFITTGIDIYGIQNIISNYPLSYQLPGDQYGSYQTSLVDIGINYLPFLHDQVRSIANFTDATPRSVIYNKLLEYTDATDLEKFDMKVRLYDDQTNGDEKANDGKYTFIFTPTSTEGTYTFKFSAQGPAPSGGIFGPRVKTLSKFVKFNVNPEVSETAVNIIDKTGDTITAKVTVKPADSLGRFLDPYRDDDISFNTSAGTVKQVFDNFGTYGAIIEFDKKIYGPSVTVLVSGKVLPSIQIDYVPPKPKPKRWPYCYCYCYWYPYLYPQQFYTPGFAGGSSIFGSQYPLYGSGAYLYEYTSPLPLYGSGAYLYEYTSPLWYDSSRWNTDYLRSNFLNPYLSWDYRNWPY